MLAFAGDVHASECVYASIPTMVDDSRFSLHQIAQRCERDGAGLVLVGDKLNSSRPPPSVVVWFMRELRNVDVAFQAGQHDYHLSADWAEVDVSCSRRRVRLNAPDGCVALGGFRIWGFDYASATKAKELVERSPQDCEIFCGHQMLRAIAPHVDGSWDFDQDWLPQHLLAAVFGDWHGMPQSGMAGKVPWYYTGSSSMRSVSEPPAKSFLMIDRAASGISVERVPLMTRPFLAARVETEDDLTQLLDSTPGLIKMAHETALNTPGFWPTVAIPFLEIRFAASLPSVRSKISDRFDPLVAAGALFYHTTVLRERVAPSAPSRVFSLNDAIDACVDRAVCPELHALVTDLAFSVDPSEVVNKFFSDNSLTLDPRTI